MARIAATEDLKEGQEVELRGWVHRLRELGDKTFVVLRNAQGTMQVVANANQVQGELNMEAAVRVKGKVHKDKRAPSGYEVHADSVEALGPAKPDWPFHRYHSVEMEMDNRHLWLRSTQMQAVFKVRQTVLDAARDFLRERDFWEVTPPIFVSSACEGGSTLFEVPYFGDKAFLSQSAQLYLEAFVPSLEKVWALTPSFRAEKSRTRRHVTEYWHLEPEAAWVDYKENMDIQEGLIKHVIGRVLAERQDVLGEFGDRNELEEWKSSSWPRITYQEAVDQLAPEFGTKWGDDLGTKEERWLTRKHGGFVFVTHYPREMKAFYMKVDEGNTDVVLNNDLMAPHVGELVGGSEREWKLELLKENMKIHQLDPADYEWYLDLRRYGSVPHSGFGMGIERLLMSLLELEHIRDTLPFPRFINRVYP